MISWSVAAVLGKTGRARLTQTMGAKIGEPGRVALVAEPIAKTGWSEGLAELGNEKRQMLRLRHGLDRRDQVREASGYQPAPSGLLWRKEKNGRH